MMVVMMMMVRMMKKESDHPARARKEQSLRAGAQAGARWVELKRGLT
jgi:ribosome assembly protein YihI (activator of Der GTPase)